MPINPYILGDEDLHYSDTNETAPTAAIYIYIYGLMGLWNFLHLADRTYLITCALILPSCISCHY